MSRRGYLIISLLLLALLLVVCIGMLLRQPAGYDRAVRRLESLQARALAEAGMENLRVQLDHDWVRIRDAEAGTISYFENVNDPQTNQRLGAYRLTLDRHWERESFQLLRIESEGMLGSPETPRARYLILATMDMRPTRRSGGPNPNPDYFRFIEWNERIP